MSQPTLVVEVDCLAPRADWGDLACVLRDALRRQHTNNGSDAVHPGSFLSLQDAPALLRDAVRSIRVSDLYDEEELHTSGDWQLAPHFYHLHGGSADDDDEAHHHQHQRRRGAARNEEDMPPPLEMGAGNDDDGGGGGGACCNVLRLPHASLDGLWESLRYGETRAASVVFKRRLMHFLCAACCLANAGVDAHHCTFHQLLLLHGPPGTGKTSLCRALAHKLSIHLSATYPHARLVEINAHSLFSRWYSESGKQVMQLFDRLRRMAEHPSRCLLVVLVDEVESIAAARQAAMRGHEPSDSIRVVNALLTQIDGLQRYSNVVMLSTTNLTCAIDEAFVDRVDVRVFVGPPGIEARTAMLAASVMELMRVKIISAREGWSTCGAAGIIHDEGESTPVGAADPSRACAHEKQLSRDAETLDAVTMQHVRELARLAEGFNGRTMKKLPFLAFSRCWSSNNVGCTYTKSFEDVGDDLHTTIKASLAVPIADYLDVLRHTIMEEHESRQDMAIST